MISDQVLLTVLRSQRRVALAGDLIRVVIGLAVLSGVLVALAYYSALGRMMYASLNMNDFGKFYYSAQLFLQGENMYGPSPATAMPVSTTESRQLLNMNPPHFHFLVLPLALLTPAWAISIWCAGSLLALLASARAISRELAWKWTTARLAWVVFAVVISSVTAANVVTGQLTFLLMLPITLAWVAARKGDWTRAAWLLGVAASIKPFLGVFWLYLLVAKRVGAWLAMTVAAGLCVLAGLLVFGIDAYVGWLGALSAVEWWWPPMNGSITGFLARSLSASPIFTQVADAPALVGPAALALSAGVVFVLLRSLMRDRSIDRTFAGLLLTAQLISPLGWIYYLWFAAGPLLGLWLSHRHQARPSNKLFLALALPGLVCPMVLTGIWKTSALATVTIGSIYWWSTLFLWASVLVGFELRETRAEA